MTMSHKVVCFCQSGPQPLLWQGGDWDCPREPVQSDPINPAHYTQHPSGVECVQITEHMGFLIGNVIKYVWRADLNGGVEDLRKARWYLDREIARREGSS